MSSTFTDYSAERNMLMKEAVPFLRRCCQEKGLDFQVSDMRWGVRDDVQDDHNTTALCLREVENCRKLSRGPYFVCFLGNKYGWRPYPNVIESSEYKIMRECAVALGKDTSLIDEWYMQDTNAEPPQHILLPITSKFPYYSDESDENKDKRENDAEKWNAIDKILTDIFRAAADEAYSQNQISEKTHHRYFWSVTENEIDVGILSAKDTDTRTICFRRTLENISLSDRKAKRFEDLEGENLDEDAQRLMNLLKNKAIPEKLPQSNIHDSTVNWTNNGIDENNPEHAKYLKEVKDFYIDKIQHMIKLNLEKQAEKTLIRALESEVLNHSQFCVAKNTVFVGREELLNEIRTKLTKEYGEEFQREPSGTDEKGEEAGAAMEGEKDRLQDEMAHLQDVSQGLGVTFAMEEEEVSLHEKRMKAIEMPRLGKCNKPLVIEGSSGTGKTALMAHIACEVHHWFTPYKPVKIIRFLGTSPESCSVKEMLVSVCKQIQVNYDISLMIELDSNVNYSYVFAYFKALLFQINTSEKPLVILLDSVDQLNGNDQAFSMSWLPRILPPHVYMIVSMIPNLHGCLENTQRVVKDEGRFVKVKRLENTTAVTILNAWLRMVNRRLMDGQMKYCMEQFEKSPQPLFLKLVAQQSLQWKSYTNDEDLILGSTIREAICLLFSRMEDKHGQILVHRALGYLTASKHGLTDAEMEDILSCDDEVLQDTYLYHLPPDENNIRLAPLLWRRLRLDFGEYLVSRKANKKDIVTWYHRQFAMVAMEMFVSENSQMLHSNLADYFTGKWSNQVKPLELYKKKKGSYPNAWRQVPSQPMCYMPGQPNLRKLAELPYHLIYSFQFESFVKLICRDFHFLYIKCRYISLAEVMNDLRLAKEVLIEQQSKKDNTSERDKDVAVCAEIACIQDVLAMGANAIRKDPNNLPLQLLGQLRSQADLAETLQTLCSQAAQWVEETRYPLLVPHTQCLPVQDSELKTSIDFVLGNIGDAQEHEKKLALSHDGKTLMAVEKMRNEGSMFRTFDLERHGEPLLMRHMPNKDVKWFETVNQDRYFFFDVYECNGRDKYDPKYGPIIVDNQQNELQGIAANTKIICMSPCSKYVFTSQGDKFSLFCLADQSQTAVDVNTQKMKLRHAIFSMDSTYLVTITSSEYTTWQVPNGDFQSTLEKSENPTFFEHDVAAHRCYGMLPQNRFIGPGLGYDGKKSFSIWDIETGAELQKSTGCSYAIDIISLNDDFTKAVTASMSSVTVSPGGPKHARVWDLDAGTQLSVLELIGPYSVAIFCGQEDTFVLTSLMLTCNVTIWYVKTDTAVPIHRIYGHTEMLLYATVALGGKLLVTAAADNTIKLWSMEHIMKKCHQMLDQHNSVEDLVESLEEEKEAAKEAPAKYGQGFIMTTCMAVTSDGKRAAVGTQDGWLIFYDLQTTKMIQHVKPCGATVSHVLGTQDGRHFVSVTSAPCLWDSNTGALVQELTPNQNRRGGASAMTERSNILIVAYGGMECYGDVYDLTTGQYRLSLQGLYGFSQVVMNSDATKAVTTFFDFPMVFDLGTGQPVSDVSNSDTMMSGCTCLHMSPDGSLIASGSTDGSVRVTSIDGTYRCRMQHRSTVTRACFFPDSQRLLTAGFKNILAWSMQNGKLLYTLSRHQDFVTKMVFVCNGAFLVSSSKDKQILVWDMSNKATVASFYASGPVNDVCVAQDLSSVVFAPETVAFLGILRPNATLAKVSRGEAAEELPKELQKAQALALTFSSQKVAKSSSAACVVV